MAEILYADVDNTFTTDSQGNLTSVTNADAVMVSVKNILNTDAGERVYLPSFAVNLKKILFEPIDSDLMEFLANHVKESIEMWDNRVSVLAVEVTVNPNGNSVLISVEFQIKTFGNVYTITRTLS